MTEIVLFHDARGLTPGVVRFADTLRAAGHVVHTPDLYDGITFGDTESGVAHLQEIGQETAMHRGAAAVADLPDDIVYAGMSMGCGVAAWLALVAKPGSAKGALFLYGAPDPRWFDADWSADLPAIALQTVDDPWREASEDEGFRAWVPDGELVDYPGSCHLFLDDSAEGYDPAVAAEATERILAWLANLDQVS